MAETGVPGEDNGLTLTDTFSRGWFNCSSSRWTAERDSEQSVATTSDFVGHDGGIPAMSLLLIAEFESQTFDVEICYELEQLNHS